MLEGIARRTMIDRVQREGLDMQLGELTVEALRQAAYRALHDDQRHSEPVRD